MKSYEILPPGMTASSMSSSADALKPYEILPEAGAAEQGLGGVTTQKQTAITSLESDGWSAMKSYEIMPPGMIRNTKAPNPYEILPAPGVAEQGLVGWTKDAASIGGGVGTRSRFRGASLGLPYDPASAAQADGAKSFPSMGKHPKPYEISPAPGLVSRGLRGKSGGCGGGCGCGGKCGGASGDDAHPSGMKKTGGCGPGKAGSCGCGGKCDGHGDGIVLPPPTGIMLLHPSTDIRIPPSWMPSGGGLAGGSHLQNSISWQTNLHPWGADTWRFSVPAEPLSCREIQAKIDELVRRITFLETAPPLPPGFCGCPPGDQSCLTPCDAVPYERRGECVCMRGTLGYLPSESASSGSWMCSNGGAADVARDRERAQ